MKLISYSRVSTTTQTENTSFGVQDDRIQGYCTAFGHEIVASFFETGSGKNMNERTELQKAIDMLQSGEADGIIVAKLDRLARNVRELLEFVDEVIVPLDKAMLVLDLQVDTSTPAGRLMLTVMGAMAEMERHTINERVQGGRKAKAASGGYAYGAPAMGQKAVDGELVEDESETKVIDLIRRHRRNGKSPLQIARYLNEQGIKSKRGKEWSDSTVRRILTKIAA